MANNQRGRGIELKRRIGARASRLRALLLVVFAQMFVISAHAAPADPSEERIGQLLDQLGVRTLLEQTPAILSAAIDAETQFLGSTPQPANWRRELEAQLKTPVVAQGVARFLSERTSANADKGADTLQRALQRLQEPIAKRARYFDLAMTQPGAEKNLRDFLAQPKTEADTAANTARRTILREIDTASSSSLLTAALQSAIAARVRQAAGGGGIDAALLRDEIAERQRYLAPLAVDYLWFDYRYLRDDELIAYRDLLRDESVQWLLDLCYQAVLASVAGELAPPPVPAAAQPSAASR